MVTICGVTALQVAFPPNTMPPLLPFTDGETEAREVREAAHIHMGFKASLQPLQRPPCSQALSGPHVPQEPRDQVLETPEPAAPARQPVPPGSPATEARSLMARGPGQG